MVKIFNGNVFFFQNNEFIYLSTDKKIQGFEVKVFALHPPSPIS